MIPSIYAELNKLLDDVLDGKDPNFNHDVLDASKQNQVWLTVKNYEYLTGVSTAVFNSSDESRFNVKGPMGKGL